MLEKEQCFCNGCGRQIHRNESTCEDVFYAHKEWGYFSEKDLQVHEFVLCESCYDKMIKKFIVPVRVSQKTEVLQERAPLS